MFFLESSVPTCQGELRHWKTGHYTLIHDNSKTEFALDLLLYCGCEGKRDSRSRETLSNWTNSEVICLGYDLRSQELYVGS